MLERHIMQAQARAMSADERELNRAIRVVIIMVTFNYLQVCYIVQEFSQIFTVMYKGMDGASKITNC